MFDYEENDINFQYENTSSYFKPLMKQYGGLSDTSEYIEPVREFIYENQTNGELGESGKNLHSKRNIKVSLNSEKQQVEFDTSFKQFLLQVAKNLAPYRTGNLREQITLDVTDEYTIIIKYNQKGTAEYTKFLDNGYPNAKWKGFIAYTRNVIKMLVAKYVAGTLTKGDMMLYGRGGSFRSDGTFRRASSSLRSTRKVTGYEKQLIKATKGITPKQLTPRKVAEASILKEQKYLQSVGRNVSVYKQRVQMQHARSLDEKVKNMNRTRSEKKVRGK